MRLGRPCATCGLPRPVAACPRRGGNWYIDLVTAPFAYREPLARQLQAFKFGRQRALGRALGLLLAAALASRAGEVDALVPVPLHPRRLRERGYNQADEIAQELARRLRRPIFVAGIERRVATRAQTDLSPAARRENVARAFRVRRNLCAARVAIVDDVITTGATVNALAKSLKEAGAVSVVAFAIARTEHARAAQPRNI